MILETVTAPITITQSAAQITTLTSILATQGASMCLTSLPGIAETVGWIVGVIVYMIQFVVKMGRITRTCAGLTVMVRTDRPKALVTAQSTVDALTVISQYAAMMEGHIRMLVWLVAITCSTSQTESAEQDR